MKRSGLSDTSDEARRVLDDVYRKMTPSRKLALQSADFRCERRLHDSGLRSRRPETNLADLQKSWNLLRLGPGPWASMEIVPMDRPIDNLDVVREVTAAFDRLGIAYALGGSWASSFYGEPRSTRDADITVEPFAGQEAALASNFGPDYHVSLDAVMQAVRDQSTFNIINTIAGFKVYVFVGGNTAFRRSVLKRRMPITSPGDAWHPLVMITAEDTILLKLEWYRLGGEISERQWLDVQGIFRVQAERLDQAYLDQWAVELGVADLLADARREAGI